jgi:excisionase family DNA binding protein
MSREKSHRDKPIHFFTVAEVAERLDVSIRTVRRWIQDGLLIVHRINGVVRISESDLHAFLTTHRDH